VCSRECLPSGSVPARTSTSNQSSRSSASPSNKRRGTVFCCNRHEPLTFCGRSRRLMSVLVAVPVGRSFELRPRHHHVQHHSRHLILLMVISPRKMTILLRGIVPYRFVLFGRQDATRIHRIGYNNERSVGVGTAVEGLARTIGTLPGRFLFECIRTIRENAFREFRDQSVSWRGRTSVRIRPELSTAMSWNGSAYSVRTSSVRNLTDGSSSSAMHSSNAISQPTL